MGIWKRLFGSAGKPAMTPREDEALDTEALIEELKAEGASAKAGEVSVKSSPAGCVPLHFRAPHGRHDDGDAARRSRAARFLRQGRRRLHHPCTEHLVSRSVVTATGVSFCVEGPAPLP